MKIESMLKRNRGTVAAATLALVILLPIGYYAARNAFSGNAEPFLEKPDPKYKECVQDAVYMRLHHMELLKQSRLEYVREGKRSNVTIERCRECHTNRDLFCNQCHYAVNLYLDCFGCHNYPDSPEETPWARASGSTMSAAADRLKAGH